MATAVSRIELGRELARSASDLKQQIEAVKDRAHSMDISPYKLMDAHGGFLLAPLLSAQAQTLHALTLLNERK